jgi:hypothetical protein
MGGQAGTLFGNRASAWSLCRCKRDFGKKRNNQDERCRIMPCLEAAKEQDLDRQLQLVREIIGGC